MPQYLLTLNNPGSKSMVLPEGGDLVKLDTTIPVHAAALDHLLQQPEVIQVLANWHEQRGSDSRLDTASQRWHKKRFNELWSFANQVQTAKQTAGPMPIWDNEESQV